LTPAARTGRGLTDRRKAGVRRAPFPV